jgi:hypothetical protein
LDNNGMNFGMFGCPDDDLESAAYHTMLKKIIDELQANVRILHQNQEMLSEQNKILRDGMVELCDAHDVTVDELMNLAIYVGSKEAKKKKKKKEKK